MTDLKAKYDDKHYHGYVRDFTIWKPDSAHPSGRYRSYSGRDLDNDQYHTDGLPLHVIYKNGKAMQVTSHCPPDGTYWSATFQLGEDEFAIPPHMLFEVMAASGNYKFLVAAFEHWKNSTNQRHEDEKAEADHWHSVQAFRLASAVTSKRTAGNEEYIERAKQDFLEAKKRASEYE